MQDTLADDLPTLRKVAIDAFRYQAFPEGRQAFERVLQRVPNDAVSLFHLGLISEHENDAATALEMFRRAARSDARYAAAKGAALYLSRRLHVREGFFFENGWLLFLDIALQSGLIPCDTLEGMTARPPARPEQPLIPKRIMQYWDKVQPPEEVSALMARIRASNPDYEHHLFSDATAQDFLATHYGTEIVDLYRSAFHVSAKADFFRLAYLFKQGGFYIDADEVCDTSLEPLRNGDVEEVYTFSRGVPSCVNNWFIGAASGTRLIERTFNYCIANLDSARRNGKTTGIWVLTGPGALSFAVLDIFCEPSAHENGNAFRNLVMLDEGDYRKIFDAPPMQYKNTKEGNWRLI